MLTQHANETEFEPIHPFRNPAEITNAAGDTRPTQTRIRIRIPKKYHSEPIISRLVSDHNLTVNFNAALLAANDSDDGWFDLDLQGTQPQIRSAFIYLAELDVEIWSKSTDPEEENW